MTLPDADIVINGLIMTASAALLALSHRAGFRPAGEGWFMLMYGVAVGSVCFAITTAYMRERGLFRASLVLALVAGGMAILLI